MVAPIVLSCGCIHDPEDVCSNSVFVQGECKKIAEAFATERTKEATEAWSKSFERHLAEIRAYNKG